MNKRNKRNSYADFGLIIAIGVFICLLIKSLLFGFTWASIIAMILSVTYFAITLKYDSNSTIVKHSTTAYLLLWACLSLAMALFDKNARPKMHAFEGTGDTIQDRKYEEENPKVTMYETLPDVIDTTSIEEEADTIIDEEIIEEGIVISEDDDETIETDSII